MKLPVKLLLSMGTIYLSTPTLASDLLLCNGAQTRCVTNDRDLAVGDAVGIFNKDGEVVATGEVSGIRGERRAVLIQQRHGSINKGYRLTSLRIPVHSTKFKEVYKVYKEPSQEVVGGHLGYSSIGVGAGSSGMEGSGFYSRKFRDNFHWLGRGTLLTSSGEVSRYNQQGVYEVRNMSTFGLGVLGGMSYVGFHNNPVSFRGEAGLGLMYSSVTVDGDKGLAADKNFNTQFRNGVGLYARGSLGVMLNFNTWHAHFDVAESYMHQAFGTSLIAGLSRDLK